MAFPPLPKSLFGALTAASLVALACAQDAASAPSVATPSIKSSIAVTDSKVIRLKETFKETADLIQKFVTNKKRYINDPDQLRIKLTNISSTYLEPLRVDPEMGKTLTRAQEEAALNELRSDNKYGKYAEAVKKLWDQTARTKPLAPEFIAKTIAPDVVPYLTTTLPPAEDEDSESGSYTPALLVGGGTILAVALLLALHIMQRKRKEQENRARLIAEAEAHRRQKEEEDRRKAAEAAAEAALPVLEKVENTNDYDMSPCIFSTDLSPSVHPLTRPERKEVKENYELHVRRSDGQSVQRFAMTKAIMSIGRKTDDASGHADIALTAEDGYLSRIHGVFMYQHMKDEKSFWLLAINQDSDRVEHPEKVRKAWLTRREETEEGVAFVVRPDDVIYLTPSTSITITRKN